MKLRDYESILLAMILGSWVVVATALIWQRHSLAAVGLQ